MSFSFNFVGFINLKRFKAELGIPVTIDDGDGNGEVTVAIGSGGVMMVAAVWW